MPDQRSTSEAAEHVGQYLELQAVVLRSSLHDKSRISSSAVYQSV